FFITNFLTEEQFLSWGWRIPFLSSVVLILIGYLIRRAVSESPVFTEMQERRKESSAPLGELLRNHKRPVILAALIFAANNAAGYLVIAFFASYGANVLEIGRASCRERV